MYKIESLVSDVETETGEKCCTCGTEHINHDGWHRFSVCQYDNAKKNYDFLIYYNVCSIDCYLGQVKKSVEELKNFEGSIDGMDLNFAKKLLFFFGK